MGKGQRIAQVMAPMAVAFSPALQVDRGSAFYRCYDPRSGRRVILNSQVGAAIDSSDLFGLDGEAMQEIESLIALGMLHVCRHAE
jgi:hypothetical protein